MKERKRENLREDMPEWLSWERRKSKKLGLYLGYDIYAIVKRVKINEKVVEFG